MLCPFTVSTTHADVTSPKIPSLATLGMLQTLNGKIHYGLEPCRGHGQSSGSSQPLPGPVDLSSDWTLSTGPPPQESPVLIPILQIGTWTWHRHVTWPKVGQLPDGHINP